MAFSRGMDYLSTWVGTPRLELEANPLMGWLGWGRRLLTVLTKSPQEQGVTGQETVAPWMVAAEGGARGD